MFRWKLLHLRKTRLFNFVVIEHAGQGVLPVVGLAEKAGLEERVLVVEEVGEGDFLLDANHDQTQEVGVRFEGSLGVQEGEGQLREDALFGKEDFHLRGVLE